MNFDDAIKRIEYAALIPIDDGPPTVHFRSFEEVDLIVEGVRALQEQAARYREALEFYGEVASWEKTIHDQRTGYWYSKLSNDGGAIARAALAGSPDTGDQQ